MGESSHNTNISNYHDVHFQCFTILFVNYVSIKVKSEKDSSLNMKREMNNIEIFQRIHVLDGISNLQNGLSTSAKI